MLEPLEVDRVDKAGLWKAYEEWPAACTRAIGARLALPEAQSPRVVVLAGMGGSGAACDIVCDWLGMNSVTPAAVVKDFGLPRWAGKGSLVVVVSLSGDTKEMLSVLDEALARGCGVVALSSGGALEGISKERGVPYNKVERLLVPRASLPGMAVTMLRILGELGVAECSEELRELPGSLGKVFGTVSPSVPVKSNPAKDIARSLLGKHATIYTPAREFSIGKHFRASMNENAKVPVYAGPYPEVFHNEIETTRAAGGRGVVLIRHREEERHVLAKVERLKSLYTRVGVRVKEVYDLGKPISNLLGWCLLLDMASIYVAVLRRTPPIETPLLDSARKL